MSGNKKSSAPRGTFKKIVGYIGKYIPLIVISVILAAVSVGLNLYVPVLVGKAVDLAVGTGNVDFEGIKRILVKIAVVVAVTAVVQWVMDAVNNVIT